MTRRPAPPAREQAAAARRGAGLFRLPGRGLIQVTGADRARWLDGMLSGDVASLAPGPARSGCPALLLTRQGRIVADLHVLLREEAFWLELAAEGVVPVLQALERLLVADRVELRDAGAEHARLGLEGPAAPAVLEAALGAPLALAADACEARELAGETVVVAAFGFGGGPARQLFVPAAAGPRVAERLLAAGRDLGLVEAGEDALEILRIEAGTPRLGAELGPDVLPAEARLERAVSRSKGCYIGQEVVERMASRARVASLLVGLELPDDPPAPGEPVASDGQRVGEVTSSCVSPHAGAIALAYVRAAYAEPGRALEAGGRPARVAELPFPRAPIG